MFCSWFGVIILLLAILSSYVGANNCSCNYYTKSGQNYLYRPNVCLNFNEQANSTNSYMFRCNSEDDILEKYIFTDDATCSNWSNVTTEFYDKNNCTDYQYECYHDQECENYVIIEWTNTANATNSSQVAIITNQCTYNENEGCYFQFGCNSTNFWYILSNDSQCQSNATYFMYNSSTYNLFECSDVFFDFNFTSTYEPLGLFNSTFTFDFNNTSFDFNDTLFNSTSIFDFNNTFGHVSRVLHSIHDGNINDDNNALQSIRNDHSNNVNINPINYNYIPPLIQVSFFNTNKTNAICKQTPILANNTNNDNNNDKVISSINICISNQYVYQCSVKNLKEVFKCNYIASQQCTNASLNCDHSYAESFVGETYCLYEKYSIPIDDNYTVNETIHDILFCHEIATQQSSSNGGYEQFTKSIVKFFTMGNYIMIPLAIFIFCCCLVLLPITCFWYQKSSKKFATKSVNQFNNNTNTMNNKKRSTSYYQGESKCIDIDETEVIISNKNSYNNPKTNESKQMEGYGKDAITNEIVYI